MLELSEKQNFKVMHVGRNDYSTVHPRFVTQEPIWNIEKYYKWELFSHWFGHVLDYFCSLALTISGRSKKRYTKDRND